MLPPGQAGAGDEKKVVAGTPGFTIEFESQQSPPTLAKPFGGVVIMQKPELAVPVPK